MSTSIQPVAAGVDDLACFLAFISMIPTEI